MGIAAFSFGAKRFGGSRVSAPQLVQQQGRNILVRPTMLR